MSHTTRRFSVLLGAVVLSLACAPVQASSLSITNGLVLHLDASDPSNGGALPSNGSSPASWLDTSGQGNHAGSKASDPNWFADGGAAWNNQPVFRFDGNDAYLTANNLGIHGAAAATIITVLNPQGKTLDGNTRWFGNTGGNNDFFGQRAATPASGVGTDGSVVFSTNGPNDLSGATDAHIITGISSRLLRFTADNGELGAISETDWGATTTISANSPKGVGAFESGGNPFAFYTGDIAEVIVFDRALSSVELNQIHGQLAAKYGLSFALLSVPEPGTIGLLLLGVAGLAASRRFRTARPLRMLSIALAFVVTSLLTCCPAPLQATTLSITNGLVLHLDASDPSNGGALPGNGTSPNNWLDTSGQGNNAGTKSSDPNWFADGGAAWNNRPVFRFDGNDAYLTATNLGIHGAAAATVITVINPTGNALNGNTRWFGNTGGGNDFFGFTHSGESNTLPRGGAGTDGAIVFSVDGPNNLSGATDTHILSNVLSRDLRFVADNGFLGGVETADWGATTTISANSAKGVGAFESGGSISGSTYFTGDIAEIIVFDRQLSSVELNQIHGQLASKYGLSFALLSVPEPGTMGLLLAGVFGLTQLRRRRHTVHAVCPALVVLLAASFTNSSAFATTLSVTNGLVLHLDASDPLNNGGGTLPSNGSSPANWLDTSAAGNSTTGIASDPNWIANGGAAWNNRPVFRFDGNDAYRIGENGSVDPLGLHGVATALTIITVMNPQGNDITTADRWFGHTTGRALGHQGNASGEAQGVAHNSTDIGESVAGPNVIDNTTDSHIFISTHSQFERVMYDNGIAGLIDTTDWGFGTTIDTPSPKGVGAYGNSGNLNLNQFFTGDLAEVIVFNRALTSVEINRINLQLGQKYGLSVALLSVPEPSTGLMMLLGALVLSCRRRRLA